MTSPSPIDRLEALAARAAMAGQARSEAPKRRPDPRYCRHRRMQRTGSPGAYLHKCPDCGVEYYDIGIKREPYL